MPTFEASDIIAIVAVVVSAITSVATLIVGYYQNKANNQAKLNEIAFEKRMEAYQKVGYSMDNVESSLFAVVRHYRHLNKAVYEDKDAEEDMIRAMARELEEKYVEFHKALYAFLEVYQQNRVFLSRKLYNDIQSYVVTMDIPLNIENSGKSLLEIERVLQRTNVLSKVISVTVTDEMQKHIDGR